MAESESARKSVWILKSTYYSDFRRRILTLLSLPNDSMFEVEYDSKWIDDELKNRLESNRSSIEDDDVYFVFLDYASSPLKFYPIRFCKVHKIQPGEPYRLILKVGNLLGFKETETEMDFNNSLHTWLRNRGLIDEFSARPVVSKLVLSCGDGAMSDALRQVEGEDDKDWQRIVKYLVEAKPIDSTPQFAESLFFRFQLLDEESFGSVKMNDGKYELKARKGYLFRLRAFQRHWERLRSTAPAKIIFGFDDKVVRHIGASFLRMPLDQRIYNKDFKIVTNAPTLGAMSPLIFEREKDEFNAASYEVSLHVPVQYHKVLFKFLPFPFGLLFLGLADNITGILTSFGLPLPSYAITLLGTLLCAISLYQFD